MSESLIAGLEEALEKIVQEKTQLPWEIARVQHVNDSEVGLIAIWQMSMKIGPKDDTIPQSILRAQAQSDLRNGLTNLYAIALGDNGMEALSILKMFHQ